MEDRREYSMCIKPVSMVNEEKDFKKRSKKTKNKISKKRKYKPKDYIWLYGSTRSFGRKFYFSALTRTEILQLKKDLLKYINYWNIK